LTAEALRDNLCCEMFPAVPLAASGGDIAVGTAAIVTGLVATSTLLRSLRSVKIGGFSVELEQVEKELDRLVETIPEEPTGADSRGLPPARVREVDRRSLALFEQYHTQGLAQSRQSFRFSLVFASLGFLIIAGAVVNAVVQDTGIGGANAVSLLGGAVIEAVSALFFVQSNRARVLMEQFFDRLREDRALDEALRLSDEVTDPLVQSRLKTALAFTLADSKASDSVIQTVMGEPKQVPTAPNRKSVQADSAEEGKSSRG
jgi:hypothetical protein